MRPALLGEAERARPDIERLVSLCDVVKVSQEDLEWLYPDLPDEDVARGWLTSPGPAIVVVTRGGAGVFTAVSSGLEMHRPAIPAELVDTVGAGDAFTTPRR